MVSATTGDGVAELKAHLAAKMPEGPWHFPEDQLTDVTDRMVAAELTREQLYHQLHAELPYASAVATEKWEDRKDGSTVIHQQILVERDSQKAIVLGKGGSRLKQIGSAAREAIAEHLGRKVHLFLHVKVNPRWDEDRGLYEDIGLDWATDSVGAASRLPRRQAYRPVRPLRTAHPSNSSTHFGTSTPAGPNRLSSKNMLPWLGSRLISSVLAPQ